MTDSIDSPEETGKAWVKPVTEYGPLAVFLAAFYITGIYAATAALMVATAVALSLSLILTRRMPVMPLVAAIIVGIFGALTLIFKDDTFIKIKPTIVYSLFAAVLFGGLLFGKSLLKLLMGPTWPMTDQGWRIITRSFGAFFIAMAIANELVWRTQSLEFWVNFKVWGSIGLTLFFVLCLTPTLNKHKKNEPEN